MSAALPLVLSAALLHASWNVLLKGGRDRFRIMAVMSAVSALMSLPALVLLPLPQPGAWFALGLSALIHVGYNLALVRAYAYGDLGQIYPVARGSSPLLVTLGAAALAGELPSGLALTGIALVSLGILSLSRGFKGSGGLSAALLTGILIAGYTMADGLGARVSGNAVSYAAWLFVLEGLPLVFMYIYARGSKAIFRFDGQNARAATAGALSLTAYAMVIFAATIAPLGEVSALRESSVVFAAIFGRVFLAESLSVKRLVACCVVAIGAMLLGLSST